MRARCLAAILIAVVLAGVCALATAHSPLCVLYTDADPMWWALGCWLD